MANTPAPAAAEADNSLLGTLAGAWSYATSSLGSLLGVEELEVVDPGASAAATSAPPAPSDKRQTAFANYRDYIGMDITSLVTLPVWIMEPYTLLQKVAEIMEYTELLDRAALCADPYDRLAWVAAFCMGPFGSNERTWKPFNPILGETFELDVPATGARFLAEQVSHHPPIAAAHAENDKWTYDIVSAPTTKFLGNSVEIFPVGRSRMKLQATGEVFSLVPPNSRAHNLVVGTTWVDCYGDFRVKNCTSGALCHLHFMPCGWFSAGRYQVEGHIFDEEGVPVRRLTGAWNSHLDCVPCDREGAALPGKAPERLWTCKPKPAGDKYGFTHFARHLNDGKALAPLASDSRRRPDRAALERGDHALAGQEKYALEERQRAEKRVCFCTSPRKGLSMREERERLGQAWAPRWFRPAPADARVYDLEASAAACPIWDWAGQGPPQPAAVAGPDEDASGRGFSPWQYPELKL